MSNSSVSIYSSEIEDKFTEHKQLMWKSFTPERVSFITREINRAYTPGVGIQASDLCRILYGYCPKRSMYEGIAYHLFELVATRDGSGHTYFIKTSEVGSSSFPVVASIWHNYDEVVSEDADSDSELSNARASLIMNDSTTCTTTTHNMSSRRLKAQSSVFLNNQKIDVE